MVASFGLTPLAITALRQTRGVGNCHASTADTERTPPWGISSNCIARAYCGGNFERLRRLGRLMRDMTFNASAEYPGEIMTRGSG